MAITAVGSLAFGHNSGTGAAASVDVPTGAATDLEVAFGGSNFFAIADGFGPPSGGGWTLRFTVDRGENDAKVRIWTRTAPAGAHTVTLDTIGGEEVWLAIRRLAGTDLANPVDDVDGATAETGSHTAPALDLATEAWLLGAAQSATFEGGGTYTPPAGFTELQDFDIAGGAVHGAIAEDQAAGPGVVGPFTFTYSQADPGLATVVGIAPAGGAGETHSGDGEGAGTVLTPGAGAGSSAISGSGGAAALTLAPETGAGSPAIAGTGQAAGMTLTPATGSGSGEGQDTHFGDGLPAGVMLTPAAGTGTPQLSGAGEAATVLLSPGAGLGSPALVGSGLACTLILTPQLGQPPATVGVTTLLPPDLPTVTLLPPVVPAATAAEPLVPTAGGAA